MIIQKAKSETYLKGFRILFSLLNIKNVNLKSTLLAIYQRI